MPKVREVSTRRTYKSIRAAWKDGFKNSISYPTFKKKVDSGEEIDGCKFEYVDKSIIEESANHADEEQQKLEKESAIEEDNVESEENKMKQASSAINKTETVERDIIPPEVYIEYVDKMIEVDKEFQSRIEVAGENKVLVKAIKIARELALKGMVEQIKVVNTSTQKTKPADVIGNDTVAHVDETPEADNVVSERVEDVDSETGQVDAVSANEDSAPVDGQKEATACNQNEGNDLENVDVSNGTTVPNEESIESYKGKGESATVPNVTAVDVAYINADMQKEKAEDLESTGTFDDKVWNI